MNEPSIKIPKFLARMKELTESLGEFYVQRDVCFTRIKDAARYFARDLSEKERADGLETLAQLLTETRALDMKIRSAQSEFCTLLEAKATGYIARIALPATIDAAGDEQPATTVVVDPWTNMMDEDGMILISPDELWVVRMVQKLFGADATDLRKIDLPETKPSLKQSQES